MLYKYNLKRVLVSLMGVFLVMIVLVVGFTHFQYKQYTTNYNEKINSIVQLLSEQHPNFDKKGVVNILNNTDTIGNNTLKEYGIDIEKESFILQNDFVYKKNMGVNIIVCICCLIIILFIVVVYDRCKNNRINEITEYIKQINKRNYSLCIDDNSEDELSILKNELYKMTIMLREVADISTKDKLSLKKNLSDISHQLKTPLTSIGIMLDNLIDDENVKEEDKHHFVIKMKREITNIRFLIENLLKLSKLESNTVSFVEKEESLYNIVSAASENVEMICDLKDVVINIDNDGNKHNIMCDRKWQIEAVTNILKNCVEHSYEGSVIDISFETNNFYSMIKITDHGVGIEQKDLPHIFERFYKGANSSFESVGIGLALAKTIIESDNGYVEVKSTVGVGSVFTIKYYI